MGKSKVHIGAEGAAIKEARGAINDILKSNNAEAVKIAALTALKEVSSVNNVAITSCVIN